jgi:hypothetical protein
MTRFRRRHSHFSGAWAPSPGTKILLSGRASGAIAFKSRGRKQALLQAKKQRSPTIAARWNRAKAIALGRACPDVQRDSLDHRLPRADDAAMLFITRYVLSFLSLTLGAQFVRASESTQPAPATASAVIEDSPKAALKAYNAAMRSGDVAAMVSLQYATNDDQRRVARSCAQSDMEVGKLIKTTLEKLGDDAAKKVSDAINDEGDDDIDTAQQTINGTHGGVTFAGSDDPTPLIRIDGTWKIDIAEMLKQFDGTADQLSDQVIRRGSAAKVTTQELVAGQYPTADAMIDVLKTRLKDDQ